MIAYTRLQPLLFVRSLVAEKEFYLKLGFDVSYESDDFVAISFSDCLLFGLLSKPDFQLDSNTPMIWQIGTTSVAGVYEISKQEHLEIVESPIEQDWGEWTVKIKSPSGYIVIFEGPEQ
jgi:hypothetical protein